MTCHNLVTDLEFADVTAPDTRNTVSGGWTIAGSAEVLSAKYTNDDTDPGQWAAFTGDGTLSQAITGLQAGGPPANMEFVYSVRESATNNGGTGACTLTITLAGTQLGQVALDSNSTPNNGYTGYIPPNFTPTVTGGDLVFALTCSETLVVYLDDVIIQQAGSPSCPYTAR